MSTVQIPVSMGVNMVADFAIYAQTAARMLVRISLGPKTLWGFLLTMQCEKAKRCVMQYLILSGRENPKRTKKRKDLYSWLAHEMHLPVEDCHFGHFDIFQLRKAYVILKGIQDKNMIYDNCGNIYFK